MANAVVIQIAVGFLGSSWSDLLIPSYVSVVFNEFVTGC